MVKILKVSNKKIENYISDCFSSSGVCGSKLREAHYYLGQEVAKLIAEDCFVQNKDIALLVMMRAGLPFGLGIADILDKNNNVEVMFSPLKEMDFSKFDFVLIADAVINTGKTIFENLKHINNKNIIIVTNVLSEKNIDAFEKMTVYTTRISKHSYKGSDTKVISNGKGPDTGDRLFNNHFFDK